MKSIKTYKPESGEKFNQDIVSYVRPFPLKVATSQGKQTVSLCVLVEVVSQTVLVQFLTLMTSPGVLADPAGVVLPW